MSWGFLRNTAVAIGMYYCSSFGNDWYTRTYGPLYVEKEDNFLEKTVKLYYEAREKYDNFRKIRKKFDNWELEIKFESNMTYKGFWNDTYVGGIKVIVKR